MTTHDVVLCSAVRTAIGAFNGSLKTVSAPDLGAVVVRETLKRAGVDAAAIGSVVMGNVDKEDARVLAARDLGVVPSARGKIVGRIAHGL